MMSPHPPFLPRPRPHPAFARYPRNGTSNSARFKCHQVAGAEQGWGGGDEPTFEVCVLQNTNTDPLPVPTLRDGPHGRPSPRCPRHPKLCPSNSAKAGRTETPPSLTGGEGAPMGNTPALGQHALSPLPGPAPRAPTVPHQPSGDATTANDTPAAVQCHRVGPPARQGPTGPGCPVAPLPGGFSACPATAARGVPAPSPDPPRYPLAPPWPGTAPPHRHTPSAVGWRPRPGSGAHGYPPRPPQTFVGALSGPN